MAGRGVDVLYTLIRGVTERRIPVDRFCSLYEATYNWDVEEVEMTGLEAEAFARLFDAVVLYSPFPDDRRDYAGYQSEDDIFAAAQDARIALHKEHR